MTTIDRAFIRAFGQEAPGPAGTEPAEATARVCSCEAEGTCACSAGRARIPDQPRAEQAASPSEPPTEPASEAASEAAAEGIATTDPWQSAADEPETAPSADGAIGPDDKPFQPAFQVDSFAWPSGCARLGMVARNEMEQLAEGLMAGREAGQQVVAMSGCRRGDGCTTLLLCVARRLAERGLNVAIVDADFDNPLLARRLGLLPDAGWEEVLADRAAVEEVMIESVQDRLAVLPLCGSLPCPGCPAQGLPDPVSSLNQLRQHYDLVLVDLGEFGDRTGGGDGSSRAVLRWIDAVVLVRDVRTTPQAELNRIRQRVEAAGLAEAGIAENFVEVRKSA